MGSPMHRREFIQLPLGSDVFANLHVLFELGV